MDIAGRGFLEKTLFERRLKRTRGGRDVSRGGQGKKEGRKEGGDQWRILKSNRAASDLVSLFLAVRHRQENRPHVSC